MILDRAAESGSSSGSSSSFSGISDPEVVNAIKGSLLSLTAAGPGSGKSSYDTLVPDISKQLSDYSKQSAFTDAAALMKQNLSASMEANKPAIQRAVEGAGTSAGSMQALLSQQLADKASTSAAALGAEQAKSYGQIAATLMNTQVKAIGDANTQQSQYAADIARLGDVLKTSSQQSNATSYFTAEQMNPKDATGGKYRAKGIDGNYALQQFVGGAYY